MRGVIVACVVLLGGCSLIAPLRDHTFDLGGDSGLEGDAGLGRDAGLDGAADAMVDAGGPCNELCTVPTPVCDPDTASCVACLVSSDCDDNNPCTDDVCNDDHTCTRTPDPVCPAEIAVGSTHSCVRRRGGTVTCWGSSSVGQLGDGMMDGPLRVAEVVGLTNAIDIDIGAQSTCAVRSDRTVVCWGAGTDGLLGNLSTSDRESPVAVREVSDAVQVACGDRHACALRAGGGVYCWGSGEYGMLGDGISGLVDGSPYRQLERVSVNLIDDAIGIAAEGVHTCVLREGGTLMCWGDNVVGDLGAGTDNDVEATPVDVLNVTGAVAIEGHCAMRSDSVFCWGRNDHGQLGDSSTAPRYEPVTVFELNDAVAISTSVEVGCAIRRDGATECWGGNVVGQLGIDEMGIGTERAVPTPVLTLDDTRAVAIGALHGCAIRTDGEIVCWGYNLAGQIDPATEGTYVLIPAPVPDV